MKYTNILLMALSLTACVTGENGVVPVSTLPTMVAQQQQTAALTVQRESGSNGMPRSDMQFHFDNFYDIEVAYRDFYHYQGDNESTPVYADDKNLISYQGTTLPKIKLTDNGQDIPDAFKNDTVKRYIENAASSVSFKHYADTPDGDIKELSGVLSTTHSNRANTNPKLAISFGMKRH